MIPTAQSRLRRRGERRRDLGARVPELRRCLVLSSLSQGLLAGATAALGAGEWHALWVVGIPFFGLSLHLCAEWRRRAYFEFREDPHRFDRAADPTSYLGFAVGLIPVAAAIGLAWRCFGG
jgi:hypothetical protein